MKINNLILIVLCGALVLAGCQEEPAENTGKNTIIRTIPINPSSAEWTGDSAAPSSRTVFEPGVGVHLIGNEPVAVYYGKAGNVDKDGKPVYTKIVYNNKANKFTVSTVNGNWSQECNFNGYAINKTGGRVTVDIPTAEQGKQLKITRTALSLRTVIQSMTFEYEDINP